MGMSIYDIDDAIVSLLDADTGEITDEEAFDDLQMERGRKIENIGLYYKDLLAEAKAIREEEASLRQRREQAERKAERLKGLLAYALNGEKYETPRLTVSYRRSKQVVVADSFVSWAESNDADDLLTFSEPKPNKTAIKQAILDGRAVEGAEIRENQSIQIK